MAAPLFRPKMFNLGKLLNPENIARFQPIIHAAINDMTDEELEFALSTATELKAALQLEKGSREFQRDTADDYA